MVKRCPNEGQFSFSAFQAVIWPGLIGSYFPKDSPHSVSNVATSHQAQKLYLCNI